MESGPTTTSGPTFLPPTRRTPRTRRPSWIGYLSYNPPSIRSLLTRQVNAVSRDSLNEADRLTYDALKSTLTYSLEQAKWSSYIFVNLENQMDGLQFPPIPPSSPS